MSIAFDAEDSERMSNALHRAWSRLDAGDVSGESTVKSALARIILDAVEQGVRDEDELVARALACHREIEAAGKSESMLRHSRLEGQNSVK